MMAVSPLWQPSSFPAQASRGSGGQITPHQAAFCPSREPDPKLGYTASMPPIRTNLEIEIKLRVTDPASLIRKLGQLGAVSHGRVFEWNTLYDTPEEAFRRGGCLVRLRVEKPARSQFSPAGRAAAILTFKAPAPGWHGRGLGSSASHRYKERLERELKVQSPRRWPFALRSLGFRPGFCYEKYRTSLRLGRLHVDLDETPIGTFLELEGGHREIDRVAGKLGFAPANYIRGTYWDLNAAECRRRRRVAGNLVFHT
jgi:adenylate cyclase, class 2